MFVFQSIHGNHFYFILKLFFYQTMKMSQKWLPWMTLVYMFHEKKIFFSGG